MVEFGTRGTRDGVALEMRDRVALIRFEAGDNSLNAGFLDAFESALDRAESAGAGALVTTGSGRFYSSGLDLAWLGGEGREQAVPFLERVHQLLARLLASPLFSVAAIGGHAFAAGAMLALAHDQRVMREDRGYFCLPEIDLATGRPLTAGMVALMAARLPAQTFHEAVATGRRYGGRDASQRGLVDCALPADDVTAHALALATDQSTRDQATRTALKRLLYRKALSKLQAPLSGLE